MKNKKEIYLITSLIIILLVINYPSLDEKLTGFLTEGNYKIVHVSRIIDGDTIVAGNESVRLLGINSPERGEKYYEEAKKFLEKEILNKSVGLKFGKDRKDLYNRTLAYAFLNDKNINLKLVEFGFANFYFPSGKDIYYNEFKEAWEECVKKNINLCEKSGDKCSECIELKELDVKNQEIIFYNKCDFSCNLENWNIKDEGRKKFVFDNFVLESKNEVIIIVSEGNNNGKRLFWKNEEYVWTKTGDSLFLRDNGGKLVLFKNY